MRTQFRVSNLIPSELVAETTARTPIGSSSLRAP